MGKENFFSQRKAKKVTLFNPFACWSRIANIKKVSLPRILIIPQLHLTTKTTSARRSDKKESKKCLWRISPFSHHRQGKVVGGSASKKAKKWRQRRKKKERKQAKAEKTLTRESKKFLQQLLSFPPQCLSSHSANLRLQIACINGSTRSDNIFRRVVGFGRRNEKKHDFKHHVGFRGFRSWKMSQFFSWCFENSSRGLFGKHTILFEWMGQRVNARRFHFSRTILMIYQERQTQTSKQTYLVRKIVCIFIFPSSIFTQHLWIV